jgi:hypothetical protein
VLQLIRVKRGGILQLVAPPCGPQKVVLDKLALFTFNLTSDVLIGYLINNNVKLFTVNGVTQQPDFDPFLLFFLETSK